MMKMNDLFQDSNSNIISFVVLEKTYCCRQISDTIFQETNDYIEAHETYDGEIVYKRNNKYYIFMGYDDLLGYEAYIPIRNENILFKCILFK